MNEAERRAATSKGGPRVFTVIPDLSISAGVLPSVINNCPKCALPTGVTVWNEEGTLGERDLLVHGWYILETDISIFWQQVNPKDACTTDPAATGKRLTAGSCVSFFVDQSTIDGVIVLGVCPTAIADLTFPCGDTILTPIDENVAGLIRISRADTVLTMRETGDSATLMVPPNSLTCGAPIPVPKP